MLYIRSATFNGIDSRQNPLFFSVKAISLLKAERIKTLKASRDQQTCPTLKNRNMRLKVFKIWLAFRRNKNPTTCQKASETTDCDYLKRLWI